MAGPIHFAADDGRNQTPVSAAAPLPVSSGLVDSSGQGVPAGLNQALDHDGFGNVTSIRYTNGVISWANNARVITGETKAWVETLVYNASGALVGTNAPVRVV